MNIEEFKSNKDNKFIKNNTDFIVAYDDLECLIKKEVEVFLVNGTLYDVKSHINKYLGDWRIIQNKTSDVKKIMNDVFGDDEK